MNILDFLEIWLDSIHEVLESCEVVINKTRSSDERTNHSFSFNLRKAEVEADLTVWESGEAELILSERQGQVVQEHFDDLMELEKLSRVLGHLVEMFLIPQGK